MVKMFDVLPSGVQDQIKDGMMVTFRSALANLARNDIKPETAARLQSQARAASGWVPDAQARVQRIVDKKRHDAMLGREIRTHQARQR